MKKLIFSIILPLLVMVASGQDLSQYQKKLFIVKGDTLPYRILYPKNYDPTKEYPMLIFLHGAGERGSNNESQLVHGGKLFLRDSIRERYPAIIVFPQCPASSYWSNANYITDSLNRRRGFQFKEKGEPTMAMSMLLKLFKSLQRDLKVDEDRVYVAGLSMGGMGTFELARRKPRSFAAAIAICGGANTATARKIRRPAWRLFHGLKDDVVNPRFSIDMAEAMKKAGADVQLTLYPNANHNSWDAAFAEPDLLSWLFSQEK